MMSPSSINPSGPSAAGRVLRGYGPVAVLALLFALMATLVPSTYRDAGTTAAGAGGSARPGLSGSVGPAVTSGGGTGGGTAPVGGNCPDRDKQIPGDPYSPPCVIFSGDNGGATAKGVTPTDVVVSARILDEKGFQQTLATLAGADITDGPADVRRTIEALAEYFNRSFQFYGRKLKVVFYDGKGSGVSELQGGGQTRSAPLPRSTAPARRSLTRWPARRSSRSAPRTCRGTGTSIVAPTTGAWLPTARSSWSRCRSSLTRPSPTSRRSSPAAT